MLVFRGVYLLSKIAILGISVKSQGVGIYYYSRPLPGFLYPDELRKPAFCVIKFDVLFIFHKFITTLLNCKRLHKNNFQSDDLIRFEIEIALGEKSIILQEY